MLRQFLATILIINISLSYGQKKDTAFVNDVIRFRQELEKDYRDSSSSPLKGKELLKFPGHAFFPVNKTYNVRAKFVRTANAKPFDMPTSGKPARYIEYGKLYFKLGGKQFVLTTYQSQKLIIKEEYRDYLFLPFGDLTNGDETYGGGRYIDFRIPKTNTVYINFNKAYNPYCAYTTGYNCPKIPFENMLPIKVEAGIKAPLPVKND